MADNGYFSHTSQDGRSPWARASEQGLSANGENLAAGSSTAAGVLEQWKKSDGHCKNMMNPNFPVFAVGYGYSSSSPYKNYWTQMFRSSLPAALDTSCYPDVPTGVTTTTTASTTSNIDTTTTTTITSANTPAMSSPTTVTTDTATTSTTTSATTPAMSSMTTVATDTATTSTTTSATTPATFSATTVATDTATTSTTTSATTPATYSATTVATDTAMTSTTLSATAPTTYSATTVTINTHENIMTTVTTTTTEPSASQKMNTTRTPANASGSSSVPDAWVQGKIILEVVNPDEFLSASVESALIDSLAEMAEVDVSAVSLRISRASRRLQEQERNLSAGNVAVAYTIIVPQEVSMHIAESLTSMNLTDVTAIISTKLGEAGLEHFSLQARSLSALPLQRSGPGATEKPDVGLIILLALSVTSIGILALACWCRWHASARRKGNIGESDAAALPTLFESAGKLGKNPMRSMPANQASVEDSAVSQEVDVECQSDDTSDPVMISRL
eukprot:TRINITY_DN3456_c0_g1_i6.p1 TRINITY_DN3456_c0_g1~~TRINITY_DN3456_c0_g1_i6.p1  ORF type:complete len:578 (+),score=101.99 TRINITY_DN3456_c0_g1_i6:222-1736(+)